MANYRANVSGSEAAGNGDVHLMVQIQLETDTDVWVDVPNGHRTLVLDAEAVLAIKTLGGTLNAQRQAVLALFKQEILAWKLERSDEAKNYLDGLVPEWPQTVTLDFEGLQ